MTLEEHLKKQKKAKGQGTKQGGPTRRQRRSTPAAAEEEVGEAVAVA